MRSLFSLVAFALSALLTSSVSAQESTRVTGALERFQPAPAGDALFGVASPWIEGHLLPRANLIVDFAYHPLSIQDGETRSTIVAHQTYLHLNASLALYDRFLVSLDMPFALAQSGDSPRVVGVNLPSPNSAEVGDLRIGARAKLLGGPTELFQIALGGYLYVPTGPSGSYAGDGAVRGTPQLVIGGKYQWLLYSASAGTTLRASARPSSADLNLGAAVVLKENFVQLGPELSLGIPFSNMPLVDTPTAKISMASSVSAELLFGGKIRFLKFLVAGLGVGPGLSKGWGTPAFFAVGSIGYEPLALPEPDTDKDGIFDAQDACPTRAGVKSEEPNKNGCPPDADKDGIYDGEDACSKVFGVKSEDPKKNGCPPDSDGDGIIDPDDACPKVAGVKNEDPKKNGCPEIKDEDQDGIADADDACPKVPGVKHEDPQKNGCPADRDDDSVPDAEDACPDVRGGPDQDPKQHGCPHITVTETEIVIKRQVQFKVAQATLGQTVDPVSNDLLTEVRNAILDNPDIDLIEVQGHADVTGPESFNMELSQGRAEAVRLWLIQKGIPSKKLTAKGYGSKAPIASNESDEGRRENRRVQFAIIKKTQKIQKP